jgi:hypothetical protein
VSSKFTDGSIEIFASSYFTDSVPEKSDVTLVIRFPKKPDSVALLCVITTSDLGGLGDGLTLVAGNLTLILFDDYLL